MGNKNSTPQQTLPGTESPKKPRVARTLGERIDAAIVTLRSLAADIYAEHGDVTLSKAFQGAYADLKVYKSGNKPADESK